MLYYLPGARSPFGREKLEAAGLGYAVEPGRLTWVESLRGPEGAPAGVVCADTAGCEEARIGLYPERQVWRKAPGRDWWLGWYRDHVPGPNELRREKQLAGHWVELGDGRKWLAPVARSWAGDVGNVRWVRAVEAAYALDEEGNWAVTGVAAAHEALWGAANAVWEEVRQLEETGKRTLELQDQAGMAVLALGMNYRVSAVEASALGLLTDGAMAEIFRALIDWPKLEELSKKNAAGPAEAS